MLIRFFKNNNPSSFVILPMFALVLWIAGFINNKTINLPHNTFIYDIIAKPISFFPFINTILAFVLLIGESFLINYIVNENEVIPKKSFLPALFYFVFMSNNDSMLMLHPALIANLFSLFAIHKLISSYRKNNAFSESFDAGFLISIGSIFYFPTIILFPIIAIGLIIFRPFNWREWVIAFIGLLVPYSFVLTYYFWNDTLNDFWNDKVSYFVLHDKPLFDYSSSFLLMIFIAFIIVLFSFSKLTTSIASGSQKNKKNLLFFIWFFVIALLSLGIAPELTSTYLSVMAIPIAVFSANYFINIKKELLGELLFLSFIITILFNDFSNYF